MRKYLTSLAVPETEHRVRYYTCLYCGRQHPDNGCCGYCNSESADLRVVQLRARGTKNMADGGWQHPMLMGPKCRAYFTRSNLRYMPADAREEIDGRKRATAQKTA